MKIILKKDVLNLGLGGDIVDVASGYARNYLLPKKFAIMATKRNITKIEAIKVEASEERKKIIAKTEKIASELNGEVITYIRKVDENEHLYGSVSVGDIKTSIDEKYPNVKKYKVILPESLKELGEYDVAIKFGHDIETNIKVIIQREE